MSASAAVPRRKADIQASLAAAEIPWTPEMTVADLLRRKAAAEYDPASMSRAEISELTIATMRELLVIHGVPELPADPKPRHLDYVNAVFAVNKTAHAAEQAALSRATMDVYRHVAKFIKSRRDQLSFAIAIGDRAAVAELTSRERLSPKQITYVPAENIRKINLLREFLRVRVQDGTVTRDEESGRVISQVTSEFNGADQPTIYDAFASREGRAYSYEHAILSSFRTDDVFCAPAPAPSGLGSGLGSEVRVQVISTSMMQYPIDRYREYYIRDPDFPYVMLHVSKSGYTRCRAPGDVCIGYYYMNVSRQNEGDIARYVASPDSVTTLDRFSVGIHWLQTYESGLWPPMNGTFRAHLTTCAEANEAFADWHKALARKVRAMNRRHRKRCGR